MTQSIDFDFNDLALEPQAELHLLHPKTDMPLYAPVAAGEDEESKPVKLSMYGPASDQFRKAMGFLKTQENKRGGKPPRNEEEAREENTKFLTMISIEITNIKFDGAVVDNSAEFTKLYGNKKWSWVAKQAIEFAFKDSNFLK